MNGKTDREMDTFAKILVVDDETAIAETLKEVLEYESYAVQTAACAPDALKVLENGSFDVVISDIKMPDMDGMELLCKIREISDVPVIMITGHGDIETAVASLKSGAFDFITKPLDLNRLLISVKHALENRSLVVETRRLKRKVNQRYEIVGQSPAVQELKALIEKVAPTDARVLITGENGTGKESVAHWLHELSHRAGNPFVEVNCAAIPSELIESELFGHEKGSFTSAIKQRKGNFEIADHGTLFLDEVGDMSLSAQAKVLRALQENQIVRVGGEKKIQVDVRVIAATNKDLRQEIEQKNFREDLYHRLGVILIHVPPLRERLEDIPLLTEHFMKLSCDHQNMPPKQFTEDAYKALKALPWRGNIRELSNMVERLLILCGSTITGEDVEHYANR
jgi:DNA-binding NtrC family response regulator